MRYPKLPSEFLYLAALFDPAAPDRNSHQTPGRGFDWQRFQALAGKHKLSAATRGRLKPDTYNSIPSALVSEFQRARSEAVIRSLAMEQATLDVYTLLENAGISSLIIKGVAASALTDGDENRIHYSSDVDVLISPDDFDQAEATLKSGSYRPTQKHVSFDNPATRSLMMELSHAHTFEDIRLGVEIDLHHRLLQNAAWMDIPFGELFERSQSFQIDDHTVRTLSDADQELYMCLHMLDHDRMKLKWVIDAARAVHRMAAPKVVGARRDLGEAGQLKAVSVSKSLLNVLYPGLETESDGRHRRSVGVLLQEMGDLSETQPSASFFEFVWERLAHFYKRCIWGGSLRAARIEITRAAADPSDVERLGLGKNWWPLYVLVGPFFVGLRYLKRKHETPASTVQENGGGRRQ